MVSFLVGRLLRNRRAGHEPHSACPQGNELSANLKLLVIPVVLSPDSELNYPHRLLGRNLQCRL